MGSERPVGEKEDTDEDLMRRVQSADESAFTTLMQRWELPVKSVIGRLVFNSTDGEELAQETFVQLWQKRNRFTEGRAFKPWILGIAVNLARNRLRWWKRRPSVALDDWTEIPDHNPASAPTAKAELERAECASAVRDAIAQLPTDFREALVLFEYESMSYQEIAGALGVSAKVVENRIARARARLRPALKSWTS